MALPTFGLKKMTAFTRKAIWDAINAVSAAAELRLVALEVGNTSQFVVHEFTPAPAATSTTALKAATATTVADQTILAAALLSGGKTALAAHPRTVTFTYAGTAANGPTSIDIVGTDINDAALTETKTITPSAATFESAKAYKTIVSYTAKGATDTDATVAYGIGSTLGLAQKIKSRADRFAVIQEVYSASGTGSVVTNGTIVSPATCAPNGGYTPNAAPDGTRKYSVTFEHDLT